MDEKSKKRLPELRSPALEAVLGQPPRWIVRWGISVILGVVLLVLVGSAFFRYPDVVYAPAVISSGNPPSLVLAKAAGRIADRLIPEGTHVQVGDTLGVIHNAARTHDVERLGALWSRLCPDSLELCHDELSQYALEVRVLGELQQPYLQVLQTLNECVLFQRQQLYEKRLASMRQEYAVLMRHADLIEGQRQLAQEEYAIAQSQYRRDSLLYTQQVLASSEFESANARRLQCIQQRENARMAASSAMLAVHRARQTVLDTEQEYEQRTVTLRTAWYAAVDQLSTALNAWAQRYLLVAPIDGMVSYMGIWSQLQELPPGMPVFAITPHRLGAYAARIEVPLDGAGKVHEGQRVVLRVDGYPYMQYGVLEGRVGRISGGRTEKGNPGLVELHNGIVTSYGDTLRLDRELTATAEIATDDRTLLSRLLSPLRAIWSERLDR